MQSSAIVYGSKLPNMSWQAAEELPAEFPETGKFICCDSEVPRKFRWFPEEFNPGAEAAVSFERGRS